MKKMLYLAALLAAMLLPCAACANGWGLPGGLIALFEHNPDYAGYVMGACDAQTDKNRPGDVAVFVMESRYHSELFVARKAGGEYRIDAQSTAALRQPSRDDSGLALTLLDNDLFELKYPDATYRFRYLGENEGWCLDSAQIAASGLTLHRNAGDFAYIAAENGEESTWYVTLCLSPKNAYGHLTYDPFSLAAMPRTLEDLRRMQHAASLLPMGQYTEELYSGLGDAQLPVYSAPDTNAVRFGSGKAAMSLKDDFLVLDWRDGFAMVLYDVSARTSRVGYVQPPKALTQALTASGWEANDFEYVSRWGRMPATLAKDAPLTDDPFVSGYTQLMPPAGTQVTALSAWNALYAVVETAQGGKPVRGFVPLWALDVAEPPADAAGMQALAGTTWQFNGGGNMIGEVIHFGADGVLTAYWSEEFAGQSTVNTDRYTVARYDPAWNLYWADVPYMLIYPVADGGTVYHHGLEVDEDGLSLLSEEGGGGFIPYSGDASMLFAAQQTPSTAQPIETPVPTAIPPATPTPETQRGELAVVHNPDPADRLHLRAAADKSSASLGKFYNGTQVRVLERENGWARVLLGTNQSGYMMEKFLAFGENAQRVACAFPTYAPNAGGGVTVTALPKADSHALFTDTGDAQVIGVHGDYLVLQSPEGIVGYAHKDSYDPR